ncbi:MAG TPA: BamA/TamA family outer membrane protein, partial [Burkholderiaceae bacterium]|nr:BamA/TamA family outer membrane protein [Burkholderiaceae bacterium]
VFFGAGVERYKFETGASSLLNAADVYDLLNQPTTANYYRYIYARSVPGAYLNYFGCSRGASGSSYLNSLSASVALSCSQDSVWGIPLTVGWARDDRDSALVPTRGRLQRANLEVGVGGDFKYVKTSYQYQQFIPLSKQYTLALNADIGAAKAYGGKEFPIFKNFYAGGLGSVRGFEQNSLGPRDTITQAALGGTKKAVFNIELSTPFPGAGNDRTLRLYTFLDAGNVFGDKSCAVANPFIGLPGETAEQCDRRYKAERKFRASAGIGISWISPLGPLRLSYAVPIRQQKEVTNPDNPFYPLIPADRIQRVQFQIGTSF